MNLFSTLGMGVRILSAIARKTHTGWETALAMGCAVSICVSTFGCGMAASPQPPSLQLPKPIHDLKATRVGTQVDLHWTTPNETTDRLKIRKPVQLQICRRINATPCQRVATIFSAPGKPASYTDNLPSALTTSSLHAIAYEISGINKRGRSAGPSNVATTLAGEAPPPIQNLSVTMSERGVVLHWQSIANLQPDASIQLQRTLLVTASTANRTHSASLPPPAEPTEQTLRVALNAGEADPGKALDIGAMLDRKYRYTAARITRLKVGTRWLQMASVPSGPVDIFTRDTFPPATPTGLVAVSVAAALNGGQPEVDLSWSANVEPDIAQYLVYRRNVNAEASSPQTASQRIAPENSATPIVAPAFRDLHVQPGHTYAYSVVAVDSSGNKSLKSPEVVVTVPIS